MLMLMQGYRRRKVRTSLPIRRVLQTLAIRLHGPPTTMTTDLTQVMAELVTLPESLRQAIADWQAAKTAAKQR